MAKTNLETAIGQFKKATQRLKEVLAVPKTDISRDSAIQRFEFTLDLSWKTIKIWLAENKGLSCQSPKECFREAYRQGLIEYETYWLTLVDLRNQTSHTYQEELAEEIYAELPKALSQFERLLASIEGHRN